MIKKMNISELKSAEIESFDLFIAFCSFENRCFSFIQNFDSGEIKKGVIFINDEACEENRNNLNHFKEVLKGKCEIVQVPLFNPIELADSLFGVIKKNTEGCECPHVLVDVTAFTHEALLMLMAISKRHFQHVYMEYVYCNASEYASESNRDGERWLSRGIREVRSVLGFAGDLKPSQETVLIMMVGYECERAWQVIDTISPEEVVFTYNDENGSTDQTNGDASKRHADLLRDLAVYYDNPKQYIIPSNNPFETAKKLEDVINDIGEGKNIIIAPMNNKLATIGAGLVALRNQDIQLCYAPAVYYNSSSYSIEGDECYWFTLDD